MLKKEFKRKDVSRMRNLITGKTGASTGTQIGYNKEQIDYKEGDIWTENKKTWTIKNGIKQNITKLDKAKKAIRVPLACPKCGGPMKHHLAKKMYKIHGFCFDPCTVEYEASLRKAGLYEQYEKRMMQGNMRAFAEDIQQWAMDMVNTKDTFVSEAGEIEDWKGNTSTSDKRLLDDVKEYLGHLNAHLD